MAIIFVVNNDHWSGSNRLESEFGLREGPPGMVVHILGSSLTGTTSVHFGGVPAAAFTVIDDDTVEATVPTVSLPSTVVTVVTPSGTAQGAYTVLFWGPWEQPADTVVDAAGEGYTSSGSTNRIAKLANWGDTPDMFHDAYHPDHGGLNWLFTGDQIRGIGNVPYGGVDGQSTWVRELGLGVLNFLQWMRTFPTDAETADTGYRGYEVESSDSVGGVILTDIDVDYELTINELAYFDGSVKTAVAADNMTGNVQVRRPPAGAYSAYPNFFLAPDAWPDPATLSSWPLLADVPMDTGMDFYVISSEGVDTLYMSNGTPDNVAENNSVITGTFVFHPDDLDTAPAGLFTATDQPKRQVPLVFALSRFADGVSLTPIASPPGEKVQSVRGGSGDSIDGSWDSGYFSDATLRLTRVRFTFRPLRIRLLHEVPPVVDLTASLTAQVRPVAAHRAQLHQPAAFSVPGVGVESYPLVAPGSTGSNDNYADARLLTGASGEVTFDITGSTVEDGELDLAGAGHTVWFVWTAPSTGVVNFDTADTPAPRWDSFLALFSDGVGIPSFPRLLDTDDDSLLQPGVTTVDGFGTSRVSFSVTAGQTYYLQVSSYDYPADAFNPSAGYPRADCKLRWSVT